MTTIESRFIISTHVDKERLTMYDSPAFTEIMGKLGRIAEDTDRKISSFYEDYTANENLMQLLNRSIDPLISLSRMYSRRISNTPLIDVIGRWNSSVAEVRDKETNYSKFVTDAGVKAAKAQLSSHQKERKFRDMDRTRLIMQRLGIDPESDPSMRKVMWQTELGSLKREKASQVEQKKKLEQEIQLISQQLIDIIKKMEEYAAAADGAGKVLDDEEADLEVLNQLKRRISRQLSRTKIPSEDYSRLEAEQLDVMGNIREKQKAIRNLKKVIDYNAGLIGRDQETRSTKEGVKNRKEDAVNALQTRIEEIDDRIVELKKSLGDDSEIDIKTVLNPIFGRQQESLSFEDYAYLMTEGFFGGSSSRPRSNSAWIKEPNLRKIVLEFLRRLDEELPVEDSSIKKSFLSRVGSKFTTPLEKRKLDTNEIIFFKKLKRAVQDSIRIVNSI